MRSIHAAGLRHGDVAERNVVVKNGEYTVIDFGRSSLHECKDAGRIFKPGATAPLQDDYPCTELYDFAYENGYWEKRATVLPLFCEQIMANIMFCRVRHILR